MVAEATAASEPARAKRRAGLSRGMLATLSVAGGLLLWEIVAQLLIKNPLFLAAPSETMVALGAIIRSGELGLHVWVSALEFIIGFGIAVVAGIAIGLAMASSRRTQAILNPWVSAFYATPIIALAPRSLRSNVEASAQWNRNRVCSPSRPNARRTNHSLSARNRRPSWKE